MPNQLADQSSPYLLQHAENPVDWFPWGPAALEKARREDKPIFLSIGYSACHWCHVMEHESFENAEIAAVLNEHFVSIKVDREERPDLDQIYMNAVQLMTGRGGWPMSVFLTPDLQPFYGGTYWPPEQRMGMPGFKQVLAAIIDAWRNRREQALDQAKQLTGYLSQMGAVESSGRGVRRELFETAAAQMEKAYDSAHGGFGSAPKFPHPMDIQVLLRLWRRAHTAEGERVDLWRNMVRHTLEMMARGGIYDHLAGGFARYSVDARWLVPHFEKMLYDNALLTGAYLEGYLATGEEHFARIVHETIGYLFTYMTDETGAFHSTEDADSEGEEGKFYVWTPDEIEAVLGEERAERFCYVYDVTGAGNFEGKNILNLPKSIEQCAKLRGWDVQELKQELAESRALLLEARDQRVRPGKDDKILVSWNGLMIDSLSRAGAALERIDYIEGAARAAEFLLGDNMRRDDGRLRHSYRHGVARLNAYLDDYAFLANALVSLYEATFDERWIDEAVELAETMLEHFADRAGGGFFYTADDHEELIARTKDLQDSSTPSASSMAATALVRLGKLTGRTDFLEAAERTIESAVGLMEQAPTAAGQMFLAADLLLGPTYEIAIVGDPDDPATSETIAELQRRFIPNQVVACRANPEEGSKHLQPLFEGKAPQTPSPTVYLCENFACQAPLSGKEAAAARWEEMAK